MNEEIFKRLQDQCWIYHTHTDMIDTDSNGEARPCGFDTKKFAELVVRECCQFLENEAERLYSLSAKEDDPDYKEVYKANFELCAEKCYDNSQMLKDHFGVEE